MTIYYCLDLRMGNQSFLTMHKQLIHVSGRTQMNLEKANPALDLLRLSDAGFTT